MEKLVKVQIPAIPNFIRLEDGEMTIPIQNFSIDELRKIGEEWTQRLVDKSLENDKSEI